MRVYSVNRNNSVKRGLTLFEMTMVLTVTMILSLIFIYSSKHLIVRTKMERVKEEHRVLTRALQNYHMDYNDYPSRLGALNTPTTYLSSLPSDPFLGSKYNSYEYIYHPTEGYTYIIISAGPDGDKDLDEMLNNYMQLAGSQDGPAYSRRQLVQMLIPHYLANKVYDPTNGSVSDGDLVTFSQE